MTTSDADVLYQQQQGIARITLNRPDKLNSFTRALHRQLRDALNLAANEPTVRVVILTGAGRGFCAGQDLADVMQADGNMAELEPLIEEWFNPLVLQLRTMPKPVIARVNGIAAGAGANVALACDFVVAAKSASFLQAFVNIGLLPDSGGTWFLPQLIGPARARGLIMLGEKLPAETAAQWGMIWAAVDDTDLDAQCDKLAAKLASLPPKSLAASKAAIDAALAQTLDRSLDLERRMQAELGSSADYHEGVAAFLQKRKANFTGA